MLNGIWATAPYLHNGSVPNLWELLKPAKDRRTSFMVGSRVFDPKNVGYDADQSPFKSGRFVADPANANGNGNGGHEYGTTLTDEQRWAIIEYLKNSVDTTSSGRQAGSHDRAPIARSEMPWRTICSALMRRLLRSAGRSCVAGCRRSRGRSSTNCAGTVRFSPLPR